MAKARKTTARNAKRPSLDPVTLEVIRNALPAVANEMAADLQRTSYNMMIYEVRDFCTALIDPEGQLISQNVGGVSHFVADLGVIIVDGMKRYGRQGFAPGDVIITGTPQGVLMGHKTPIWLKPGDEVAIDIAGLGVLTNTLTTEESRS